MRLAIDLIVVAGQTFRGAARTLAVLANYGFLTLTTSGGKTPCGNTPCANTIETWLLRLGHYLLHGPLPVANDWAWFVDLTMTIGSRKVLVIAGCPLSQIPFGIRNLAPSDLSLVHVAVLASSTHATILPELHKAAERTGMPRSIHSDEGSDVVKATRRLIEELTAKQTTVAQTTVAQTTVVQNQVVQSTGEQTTVAEKSVAQALVVKATVAHVLDIAHIGANVLKTRWIADPRWTEFLRNLMQTNQQIRQTELAYLLSPKQRDKGRFMSVGVLLRFARRVLYWLDQKLANATGEAKYGWLKEFRQDLKRWSWEQEVVHKTIAEVRHNGWEDATLGVLEDMWRQMPREHANVGLIAELRTFATKMIGQVKPNETLPGSTEALEASFGRWKQWVEAGPNSGLSRLVLAIGNALKPVPEENYQEALEKTPLKAIWAWIKKNVGTTTHRLRTLFNRQTQAALP